MEDNTHPTDLLPAFALGILDFEEKIRVEAHVESCPVCRAEVDAFVEVTGQLAMAVPEEFPPAGLRKRVLEEAYNTPARAAQPQETRGRQESGSWLRRFLARPVWSPVTVILVVVLVISILLLWQRLRQLESGPPLVQQAYILMGTDAAPNAGGVILVGQVETNGTLVINGLSPLEPDQQYQLWLVRDEERDTGAIFSVSDEGFNSVLVTAPQALTTYSRFGITIEPAGGSPGPTGAGVLRSAPVNANGG